MNIEAQQVSKCSASKEEIMMTFLRNLLSKVLSPDTQRIQFFLGNEAIFGFSEFY